MNLRIALSCAAAGTLLELARATDAPADVMIDHGQGYCDSGYYAGWDGAGTASQEACNAVCLGDSRCTFAAWNPGRTCSRYDGVVCDLNGRSDHYTYKKVKLAPPTNAPTDMPTDAPIEPAVPTASPTSAPTATPVTPPTNAPYPPVFFGANGGVKMLANDNGTLASSYSSLATNGNKAVKFAFGDVDGDGDNDMICMGDKIFVLQNEGAGSYDFMMNVPNSRLTVTIDSLRVADLDGDGKPDIFAGTWGSAKIFWNDGIDGNGNIVWTGQNLAVSNFRTMTVETGDLDGDGDMDIIMTSSTLNNNGQANPVVLLKDANTRTFSQPSSGLTGGGVTTGRLLHINDDDVLDFLLLTRGDSVKSFLGNGDGTFEAPVTVATPPQDSNLPTGNTHSFIEIGDFNRDGNMDFLWHWGGDDGQVDVPQYIYLNNGDGSFVLTTTLLTDGPSNIAEIGDVNNDGALDIVFDARTATDAPRLYLGKGDGTFHDHIDLPQQGEASNGVAIDFDIYSHSMSAPDAPIATPVTPPIFGPANAGHYLTTYSNGFSYTTNIACDGTMTYYHDTVTSGLIPAGTGLPADRAAQNSDPNYQAADGWYWRPWRDIAWEFFRFTDDGEMEVVHFCTDICNSVSDAGSPNYCCNAVTPVTNVPSCPDTPSLTDSPTTSPTMHPTSSPTSAPTNAPTNTPTESPTTASPTASPTETPTDCSPSPSTTPLAIGAPASAGICAGEANIAFGKQTDWDRVGGLHGVSGGTANGITDGRSKSDCGWSCCVHTSDWKTNPWVSVDLTQSVTFSKMRFLTGPQYTVGWSAGFVVAARNTPFTSSTDFETSSGADVCNHGMSTFVGEESWQELTCATPITGRYVGYLVPGSGKIAMFCEIEVCASAPGSPSSRALTSPACPPPTTSPTSAPTSSPTETPTESPTSSPTETPTESPTTSPTSSPTSSPTEAGPWDLDHLTLEADFTNANTVTLEYIVGVGRQYSIDLYEKDCATPVNATLFSTSVVTTPIPGNTTHHKLTITHSFVIGALASSNIWDTISKKLQVCQKVSLVLGNMDIVDDVREIDVDFDLDVDFNTTVTLEGGVTENVTDRVTFDDDVRGYKCNGGSTGKFVENDDLLAPNQKLAVCIVSGDETVILANLTNMEIKGDAPSGEVVTVGVVANRAPIVKAITSISVESEGILAETRVPIDRFSFEAGKNITISGMVELAFAGTAGTRKLRALQVVGEDTEEAGYSVTVNLKSEGGAVGEGQAPIGASGGFAIMGKVLGGLGLVVLAVMGLVM